MCIPYLFIDASTEGYPEEEVIYEEEEENFDHFSNQGKLIPIQALLVQDSKDTLAIYLRNLTISKSYFAKLYFSQSIFIVHLCLSLALLQEFQGLV